MTGGGLTSNGTVISICIIAIIVFALTFIYSFLYASFSHANSKELHVC